MPGAPTKHFSLEPNAYRTRDQALEHLHWPVHEKYAGARCFEISDGDSSCTGVLASVMPWLLPDGEPADADEAKILRFFRDKQYAKAVAYAWNAGVIG